MKMNAMLKSFCIPWNVCRPSCVFVSTLITSAPTNSCNTMLAVTIGPIPRLIKLPKLAANKIESVSNLL